MELRISAKSHHDGSVQEAECTLHGQMTLGRGPDSPVPLNGAGISRDHFRLHSDDNDNGVFLTDLSSNGTWINGRRLTRGESCPVGATDSVRIPGYDILISFAGNGIPKHTPDTQTVEAHHAAIAAPAPARPASRVPLAAVRGLVSSFSFVEKYLLLIALLSFSLIVIYLWG